MTDHKYYIYSLRGSLKRRIDYSKEVKLYGSPKAVSNNGTIYIFKKQQSCILTVLMLTTNGFEFVKLINLKTAIRECIAKMEEQYSAVREDIG